MVIARFLPSTVCQWFFLKFYVYIYNIYIYGCFLKWWYPQNTPKWSVLVGKPMVVWYHHFRKPPYMNPMGERLPRDDMSPIFPCHVSLSKRSSAPPTPPKGELALGVFFGGRFFGNGRKTQGAWSFLCYMGVSKNRGTPKWMVYKENPIKMDDLGVPLFSETSI